MNNYLPTAVSTCALFSALLLFPSASFAYTPDEDVKRLEAQRLVDMVQREASAVAPALPTRPNYLKELSVEGHNWRRLVIKFEDSAKIRLRNGLFSATNRTDVRPSVISDLGLINDLLRNGAATRKIQLSVQRLFSDTEEALDIQKELFDAEKKPTMDLNSFYLVEFLGDLNPMDAKSFGDELRSIEAIDSIYFQPKARPTNTDIAPTTLDYESSQLHLNPAPAGIDAKYAWTTNVAGDGRLVKVVIVGNGFLPSHEDLPSTPVLYINDLNTDLNHGTATVGVILGQRTTSYGITGIAYGASGGYSSDDPSGITDAIVAAINVLGPGDVIDLELGTPLTAFDPVQCGCTLTNQPPEYCRELPIEYYTDILAKIQQATNLGIVVVEGASNGFINLDTQCANGQFNPTSQHFVNSNAIIVGAAKAPGSVAPNGTPIDFSDYGARVDLRGWGDSVFTSGYGDVRPTGSGSDARQFYTAGFNGTSSATPMVAGAVAVIQSVQKQRKQNVFSVPTVRDLLVAYGSGQAQNLLWQFSNSQLVVPSANHHVGPQPDLRATLDNMSALWDNRYDVDANGQYDALTDGLLIIRYMFGLTGSALTNGALGSGAIRTDPGDIVNYLNGLGPHLDVDGNGANDALTDGLMILRQMFGLTGTSVTNGAIGIGATRATPDMVEAFIRVHKPASN